MILPACLPGGPLLIAAAVGSACTGYAYFYHRWVHTHSWSACGVVQWVVVVGAYLPLLIVPAGPRAFLEGTACSSPTTCLCPSPKCLIQEEFAILFPHPFLPHRPFMITMAFVLHDHLGGTCLLPATRSACTRGSAPHCLVCYYFPLFQYVTSASLPPSPLHTYLITFSLPPPPPSCMEGKCHSQLFCMCLGGRGGRKNPIPLPVMTVMEVSPFLCLPCAHYSTHWALLIPFMPGGGDGSAYHFVHSVLWRRRKEGGRKVCWR